MPFGSAVFVSNDSVLAGEPHDFENGASAGPRGSSAGFRSWRPSSFGILCCEQIPDYTTGPVAFEIRWENPTALAISTQRGVRLQKPDGRLVDLVTPEQVDLVAGTNLVEPFNIDLTPFLEAEGAALGDYALILDWTDAEGFDHDDVQLFSIAEATPVPGLIEASV